MEVKTNKILLPIDFQEQSLLALEYAKFFAKGLNAEINLLHIIEETGLLSRMFRTDEQTVKMNNEVKKMLEGVSDKLKPQFKVESEIKYGKAYEQIEAYADEIKPTFIIMGKTETHSFKKRLMGSNTLHVINEVKYPVISVRGNSFATNSNTDRDIVLPLDFSKPVAEQVTTAIEFGKMFKSAIRILTVLRHDRIAEKSQLLTNMSKTQKLIEKEGLKCDTKMVEDSESPIVDIINSYAKELDAQLVIIMTRAEANFSEFFIGATAKDILDNCDFPVLSVVPWDAEAEDSIFKVVYDPLNVF